MVDSRLGWLSLCLGVALAASGCGRDEGLNIEGAGNLPTSVSDMKEMNAEGVLRMAKRLEAGGDYANALRFYQDAISRDSTLAEAHAGAARMFTIAGATREATEHYGRAFELNPGDAGVAARYARGLLAQERAGEARAALTRHMAGNPGTPEIKNLLGLASDLLLEHAAAQTAYREGLAMLQPGDDWGPILTGNLALSLAIGGDYSEAILLLNPRVGDLERGLQGLTKTQSQHRQNLALVYALSGNPEAAFEIARTALPEEQADFNRRFYEAVAELEGYDRVRAVLLGELPEPAAAATTPQ